MNDQNKAELRRLAEAATESRGPRRVEVDHNDVPVIIGDGSWKILSAWHTPDGKGMANAKLAAACSPAAILSLLDENAKLRAENERLRKDAERYRWMRDIAPRQLIQTPLIAMCGTDGSVLKRDQGTEMLLSGVSADEAIDAAISNEGNANG